VNVVGEEKIVDLQAALIRNVIGPLWAKWERSPYLRHLSWLRVHQYDPPQAVRDRQWRTIKHLLRHAYESVPYYRCAFDEQRISPAAIRSFADFTRVPILTKSDIRAAGESLLSNRYAVADLHRKTTSGSTGVALTVWVDDDSLQWKRACTLRSDEWSGWRLGERVAKLWGNPGYLRRGLRGRLRNALLERARYLDTLKMDEAALAGFARRLKRRSASLLFGHAHSVFLFAEYVRDNRVTGIRPRGIVTTAMILHDWQRRVIEDVFGCKVTNRYGSEEVSLIGCECAEHTGLHINADGVYVEVLRDGRTVPPGEPGSVVVTDLTNRAMPLIRYQIGDVAVLSDKVCPCGRGLPLLERLEGREADYVVTAAGELISGISLTENFALHVPGIAQIQIVQEAVDRFVFRIVRGTGFGPASRERIDSLVTERFGRSVAHTCEFVDRIPQEPSGKYRFCISRVPNPFTRAREAIPA
jgi:phenylacetate-CoA ligase